MTSKLSRFCDGILEATWLAAIIVLPVFFNVFSSRIFEPDKIALLRSLALLSLAAWIIKAIDQAGLRQKQFHSDEPHKSWLEKLRLLLKIPFVLPAIFLALVYLLATFFSVTPQASFWGSYQRLQGTYTTLSYLVIFAAIAANLRKRAQVERIFTTIIVTSLPVALYGVLQRYHLDPIPWGGDVSVRIASSLGNSIFVAAYLIMVFPITLGRIVESFRAILKAERMLPVQIGRAAAYVFIAVLQLAALYMSGSRGPALGWLAGSVFFIPLMLTVWWRKRWATVAWVGFSIFLALFLLVFNLESGPLEALRSAPGIGRFGLLLNAESNSALVRRYIWEGVVKLVSPHPALEFPDGSPDRYNVLRPLIGYGPESMFVAYNPFYTPALGVVERRNATPDRSHNETWDSIVTTGVLGLIAYLWIFYSVFYYGLKWMGLISTRFKQRLFLGLFLLGGIGGGIVFSAWRGVEYLGVGVPFGIFIGLIVYILLAVLITSPEERELARAPRTENETAQFIAILVIVAAIVSHFVEIHFGISISVTRAYFWIYTALLLLVGYLLPKTGVYEPETPVVEKEDPAKGSFEGADVVRAKRRAEKGQPKSAKAGKPGVDHGWLREALACAGLVGILLATLGFDFITNGAKSQNPFAIIGQSFMKLPSGKTSFGILMLLVTTWFVAAILFAAEAHRPDWGRALGKPVRSDRSVLKTAGAILGISLLLAGFYWLWHSIGLAVVAAITPADYNGLLGQVNRYANVITTYALFVFGLIILAAFTLPEKTAARDAASRWWALAVVPLALLGLTFGVIKTNLHIVQADITFKLADSFNKPGAYPVAIKIYDRANQLAPGEDYYYLYLGRAFLNQAGSLTDLAAQEQLFTQAAADLKKAQGLNPLNTDHTANLARLYSLWASFSQDPAQRIEKAGLADEYFGQALKLSPNNVRLWNEWAYLAIKIQDQPEQSRPRLEQALQIDPSFDWTYAQLGDLAAGQAAVVTDADEQKRLVDQAVDDYNQSLAKPGEAQMKFNFALSLGNLLLKFNRYEQAAQALNQALTIYPQSPTAWRVYETLAQIYLQQNDRAAALQAANTALSQAPEDQKSALQTLINQIQAQP